MKTIVEILSGVRPEFDFSAAADFIAEGMLDSLDVITLVSDLDRNYGISIEGTDILPENFGSLAAIRALLAKYGVDA
jgi:acyl carrier protein